MAYDKTNVEVDTGSIFITNASTVGSISTQTVIGSFALTTGSILTYGSAGGYTGSDATIIGGSIQTYNPVGVGSTRISEQGINLQVWNSGLFSIVGSITSMPSISVSTGSEVYIKAGSVQTYSPVGTGSMVLSGVSQVWNSGVGFFVVGSIVSMPPVSATNPSVYQASGIISNTGSVGLVGGDFNGSVWPLRMIAGSNLLIAGSINIISNPVPISGAVIGVSGIALTAVWTGIGSIYNGTPEIATYVGTVFPGLAAQREIAILYNSGPNATNIVKVRSIKMSTYLGAAVAGLVGNGEIYRINHFPIGVIGSRIEKLDTAVANPPANVFLQNTGSESLALLGSTIIGAWSFNPEETVGLAASTIYEHSLGINPITLRANQGIVLHQSALASAGSVGVVFTFTNE